MSLPVPVGLSIFGLLSWLWLGDKLTGNIALGFGCICFGAFLIFHRFGVAAH